MKKAESGQMKRKGINAPEAQQAREVRDGLTGLLDRTSAERQIRARLGQLGPEEACALMIVDLDNFKTVNDTLGHQAGDQALGQVGQILAGLSREGDIMGRLGGDEFILFFSGRLDEAAVARKAQGVCTGLQFSLEGPPPAYLSASAGVCFSLGSSSFAAMYYAADKALYKVKESGKGTFCVSPDTIDAAEEPASRVSMGTVPVSGLLENMESGVALLEMGEQMRIIYMSPSFFRAIRVEPEQVELPIPIGEIIHPDDLADLERELLDGLCAGQTVEHTHRVSMDRRTWFWWRIKAARIPYDSPSPVMLVTTTDVSEFEENAQRLHEVNRRLKTAFAQTGRRMWEVDLATRAFFTYSSASGYSTPRAVLENFPESLIARGWVHPDSAARLREFAAALLDGQDRGYGNFILRHPSGGTYSWTTVSYRMLYNENGRAVRAVGLLGQTFRTFDLGGALKRPLPSALQTEMVVAMSANLTRNAVRSIWREGRETGEPEDCDQALAREAERIFLEDDQRSLGGCFRREELLNRFADGRRWAIVRYRRVDGEGVIQWVGYVANLARDPVSGDIWLFLCICRVDDRVALEETLRESVERDPVTGLYTRETMFRLLERQLLQNDSALTGLAVIHLGGLDGRGESGPESIRFRLITAFRVALGPRCLVGQCDENSIAAFFPEVYSKFDLRTRLDDAFSFVRGTVAGDGMPEGLRLVATAVCCPPAAMGDCAGLQQKLEGICALWGNTGADKVIFPEEGEEWTWPDDQNVVRQTWADDAGKDAALSAEEADLAFRCVEAMLKSETLKGSMQSVLSLIGNFCEAERAYFISVSGEEQVVTMPYEWMAPGRHSIRQVVSGMPADKFMPLKWCMEKRTPLFLDHPGMKEPWGRGNPRGDDLRFAIYPLPEGREFLCVENIRRHRDCSALMEALIPSIQREEERFSRWDLQMDEPGRLLADLPNLLSYMDAVAGLDSERFTSMGAVYLKMTDIDAINDGFGFRTGQKIMWHAVKTMIDMFGRKGLYRVANAEFALLCPNVTRDIFTSRCERLEKILANSGGRPRIGYTWANGVFRGRQLVREAQALMQYNSVGEKTDMESLHIHEGTKYHGLEEAIADGRFTVYLQPKIDLRTGELHGAEALVRGVDEAGGPVSPVRFVPYLERSGGIRDLDLFVLEQTVAALDRWRKAGWRTIRVSLNFSRVTLFNRATPAAILAIWGRYPQVPLDAVEVEITESAGSAETMNLMEAMERIRELGMPFALDDFGSQYSNIAVFTNIKFDTIKLDRSMVTELSGNPVAQMLIRSIAQICDTLGMECVAEGVENPAQLEALREAGCVYVQGYCYDRPMPMEKFEEKYLRPKGEQPAE